MTLRVFSATGGIEKVCRIFTKSIRDLNQSVDTAQSHVLSMYDRTDEANSMYIGNLKFQGFGKKKLSFAWAALQASIQCDVVILSHINLLSIGFVIKLFRPSVKLVMFAHGIEVWDKLPLLRRLMLQKADQILCVSRFTLKKLETVNKIPGNKLTVLNNCLDPYLPEPIVSGKSEHLLQRYQLGHKHIILFTLTRLSSNELYKGYDNVIRTLPSLLEKNSNVRYMIVGKYDDLEKVRLDKLLEEQGLSKHVLLTGYVPDSELAAYFRLADIYIMPSQKEGFGISFIEAMYYGVPVIAGNKDGSTDALLNGELGILVDPDSLTEIESAIEELIMHKGKFTPDKEKLLSHFGYEVYKRNLDSVLKKMVRNYA